jgi:two-component system sensor kinase FixL
MLGIDASVEAISAVSLDAVIATSRVGDIVSWNKIAEKVFGWRSHEVVGLPIHEVIIPENERSIHVHAMDRFNATGKVNLLGRRVRTTAINKRGETLPVELAVTLLGGHNGGLFISFIRDLSGAIAAEREIEELNTTLVRLSRASAAEEIASRLTHELAQPLTAISNQAATASLLLESGGTTEAAAAMLDQISDSARKAGSILRSIRDISPSARHETTCFQLKQAVDEVIGLLEGSRGTPGATVVLIDDSLMVGASRIKIQQVLLNLIRNALEAIDGVLDGIVLISAEKTEDTVRISVGDNGAGIPDAMLPLLFHSVQSSKPGGLGAGLSICRTILEGHGGRIWHEKKGTSGATFVAELPVR